LVIAKNMMAMNAQRQFNIVGNSKKKSMEKLSSGYCINRAADDAAGLTISEKMRSQIRGLNQGANNTMDGISMLQVADGALSEVHDMLHRVTELSVKSANGTYPGVASDIVLPDGTTMEKAHVDIALNLLSDIAKAYEAFSNRYSLDNNPDRFKELWTSLNNNLKHATSKPYYISSVNDAQMKISQYFKGNGLDLSALMTSYNHATTSASGSIEYYKSCSMSDFSKAVIQHNTQSFKDFLLNQQRAFGTLDSDYPSLTAIVCAPFTNADSAMKGVINGYKYIFGVPVQENNSADNDGIWIQSGAKAGDGMNITIGTMDTGTLGMTGLDVTTIDSAKNAIDTTGRATQIISELRSNIGAQQNRLEHTYNNVTNIAENTQAAETRIRDTDMAKEMFKLSTQNILEQVGQSMLVQANHNSQGVLSLLQ